MPVVEMIDFKGVKFWESEFCEHNILSINSSLEFQELGANLVDRVFETFVFRHIIEVMEDIK